MSLHTRRDQLLTLSKNPLTMSFACRTFLQFEGVNNAFYLWVNSKPVGYSQDSCLPAEFEVSQFLQRGQNIIACQVKCTFVFH